jgi:putative glycosyltransferase (TIGR04348 family)
VTEPRAPLRIEIVTPAPRRSRGGNRITALRWAGLLRELGHHVAVRESWSGARVDVLVALHAEKSSESVERCAATFPDTRIVVALAGTDAYGSSEISARSRRALERAARIVVLQPLAAARVPPAHRDRVRTLFQSAPACSGAAKREDAFVACVVGHLREIKDPFLAAAAARRISAESRLRVVHLGEALDPDLRERALAESASNPRYEWRGARSRRETLREIAAAHVLVVTSRAEGGANVVAEALVAGTPILATRIDGTVGMLGPSFPGYFEVGDADGLARRLERLERDSAFAAELAAACAAVRPRFERPREREAWAEILREVRDA